MFHEPLLGLFHWLRRGRACETQRYPIDAELSRAEHRQHPGRAKREA